MDNNVITIWVAALAVLTGGCSAVHTASGENRDTIADKQVSLVREQIVAQVQVDAETVYRQMIEFSSYRKSQIRHPYRKKSSVRKCAGWMLLYP